MIKRPKKVYMTFKEPCSEASALLEWKKFFLIPPEEIRHEDGYLRLGPMPEDESPMPDEGEEINGRV